MPCGISRRHLNIDVVFIFWKILFGGCKFTALFAETIAIL